MVFNFWFQISNFKFQMDLSTFYSFYKSQYLVAYLLYSLIVRKATMMGIRYGHRTIHEREIILHFCGICAVLTSVYCSLFNQYILLCLSSILNLYLQAMHGHFNPPLMADLAIVYSLYENSYPSLVYLKMVELIMEHFIGIFKAQRYRLTLSTLINTTDFYLFLNYPSPGVLVPKKCFEILLFIMVCSAYLFYLTSIWLTDQYHIQLITIDFKDDFYITLLKTSILLLKDEEKRLGLRVEEEKIIDVQFNKNVQITTRINENITPLLNKERKEYKILEFVGLEYLKTMYYSLYSIVLSFFILCSQNHSTSTLSTESIYVPSTQDQTDVLSTISESELVGLVKDQFEPVFDIKQPISYNLRRHVQPLSEGIIDTCVICYSNPRCIILRPCNCFILCDECRLLLAQSGTSDCPFCRRSIQAYSRLYRP